MEELINKNNQLIKEVVETLPHIGQSIDDTTKNYQYYIRSIKNEVFEIKEKETYSEAIKRGEGIFDRIDETEKRRKLVIEKSQEAINKIERIIQECKSDEETLSKTRNELIDKIIYMEEMIMRNKIFRKPKETDTIREEFNKKKEEWEKQYTDYLERKKRKEEERIRRYIEEKLLRKGIEETKHQIEQLEEWTNRKVGNILFDSDKDNWNVNTSIFNQRIMNKEHIMILIEGEDGNKFGGYVNSKIDISSWINDSQSFVFSLESKGRMEGMKKFDIKEQQHAFCLLNKSHNYLFAFGGDGKYLKDIVVHKENDKTQSFCDQNSFEYEGISNALCGKYYFTPKRIIVIEMIQS